MRPLSHFGFALAVAAVITLLSGYQDRTENDVSVVDVLPADSAWPQCVGELVFNGPVYGAGSLCGVGAPPRRQGVTYGTAFRPGKMTEFARIDWPDSIRLDLDAPTTMYVAVTVGIDGSPMRACVTDGVVAEVADHVLGAAMQCQFSPATLEGEPVLWEVILPYGIN
jgi:hypothetical protein